MGTRVNSAESIRILVLVRRLNAMIYKTSSLKSVPFPSVPFFSFFYHNSSYAMIGFVFFSDYLFTSELARPVERVRN